MGGRRLPEGYIEIGRWTMKQASVKEFLLCGLVSLVAFFTSFAAAVFVVGTTTESGEMTIDGEHLSLDCCWGSFSESYCTKPSTASSSWLSAADRALGLNRGPGLGLSSTRPLPAATSTGLDTSIPRRRVGAGNAVDHGAGDSTGPRGRDDLLASVVTWALVLNVVGSAGDMLMMRKGDVLPTSDPLRRHL